MNEKKDVVKASAEKKNKKPNIFKKIAKFFRECKNGVEGTAQVSLSEGIFKKRVRLMRKFQEAAFADELFQVWRKELAEDCQQKVAALNPELFAVQLVEKIKVGKRLLKPCRPGNVTGHYHRVVFFDHRVPIFLDFRHIVAPAVAKDVHRFVHRQIGGQMQIGKHENCHFFTSKK